MEQILGVCDETLMIGDVVFARDCLENWKMPQ